MADLLLIPATGLFLSTAGLLLRVVPEENALHWTCSEGHSQSPAVAAKPTAAEVLLLVGAIPYYLGCSGERAFTVVCVEMEVCARVWSPSIRIMRSSLADARWECSASQSRWKMYRLGIVHHTKFIPPHTLSASSRTILCSRLSFFAVCRLKVRILPKRG